MRAIKARGGEATAIACNISSKEGARAPRRRSRARRYGGIDVLVCNAAVNPHYGPSQEIPDSAFDKVMNSNIRSNHWLCQMVIPDMAERRDGAVDHRLVDRRAQGVERARRLSISKAADMQMARNLAVEWGPRNVRVNCIAPGLVRTDFRARSLGEPRDLRAHRRVYPLRRIGEPDEIAGAAVFLASRAGSFMTGQTIVVDGGATIAG